MCRLPSQILICDDSAPWARCVARHTKPIGAAQYCATISAALEFARRCAPRVIFLDVHLGDGPTGLQSIQLFKQAAPFASIIVMTSLPKEVDGIRAISVDHAFAYIDKHDAHQLEDLARKAFAFSHDAELSVLRHSH